MQNNYDTNFSKYQLNLIHVNNSPEALEYNKKQKLSHSIQFEKGGLKNIQFDNYSLL